MYLFFPKQYIYTKTQKIKRKNIEQCPNKHILDLNRGNDKVKIKIKEKILK